MAVKALTPVLRVGSGVGSVAAGVERGQGRGPRFPAGFHLLRGNGAEPEHADRHLLRGPSVEAEILSSHHRFQIQHVVIAQHPGHGLTGPPRQRRIVVGGWSAVQNRHQRETVRGHTGGASDSLRDPPDAVADSVAGFIGVVAHGELEPDLVGNDAVLGAPVDGSHRDHRRIDGRNFPADDGLERQHGLSGHDHGILGGGRIAAVSRYPTNHQIDGIDPGEGIAAADAHPARLHAGVVVERDGVVGDRKLLEQSVGQHGLGPGTPFFGRLSHHHQGALPTFLLPAQDSRSPHEAGHVDVVAAGVHEADGLAVRILNADFAGIFQAGLLGDGESVQVGSEHEGRPLAVSQKADDAVPSDAPAHLEAQCLQLLSHALSGPRLLKGDLGVGVQVAVELEQGGIFTIHPGSDPGELGTG